MSDEKKIHDSQSKNGAKDSRAQPEKPARRAWVKPTFEQTIMKEALGSLNVTNMTQDSVGFNSS